MKKVPLLRQMADLEVNAIIPGEYNRKSVHAYAVAIRVLIDPKRYYKLVEGGILRTDVKPVLRPRNNYSTRRDERLAALRALGPHESVIFSNVTYNSRTSLLRLERQLPFPVTRKWLSGGRVRITRDE